MAQDGSHWWMRRWLSARIRSREVLDAVLGNCANIISFRVSGQDGELLSRAYADHIPAKRFVNLARGQILVRLQEQGVQHVPFEGETLSPLRRTMAWAR